MSHGLEARIRCLVRHPAARVLGLALTALALGVLVLRLQQQLESLRAQTAALDAWRVGSALGILLLSYAAQARVWQGLARHAGARVSWRDAFGVLYMAQVGKYLPGLVWGYLGAVHWGARAGVPVGAATYAQVGLVVSESAAALVLGALALAWIAGLDLALLTALGLVLGGGAVLGTALGLRWLGRFGARAPGTASVAGLFAWIAVHWLAFGLGYWLLLGALWPITLGEAALATALHAAAWLVGYWTLVVPSGLGVRELVQATLLAPVLPAPLAVAVPLLTRVWLTVGDVLAWAVAAGLALRRSRAAIDAGARG